MTDPGQKKLSGFLTKSMESSLGVDGEAASGLWDSEIKAFIDNTTLKSLYFSEDWVFILLDLLASEISNVDMRVMKKTMVGGQMQIEVDEAHPLNKLMENPNPWQDYSTWMYLHVVENTLMGNAIQWYARSLNQLFIIPAEEVFLDCDPLTGKLRSYIVHSQIGPEQQRSAVFPPDQILHQRRPNPISIYWGLSPFVPNRKSLLFNKYSQDYLNSFYLKQATGQMALTLDKSISEEAAIRLIRSFESSYTGRKNTRRTMLLPKGVDVKELSQTIADQNLIEIINQNQEKIINILRIPKHALSLAEAGSLGSEEHKMALRFMWTSAILPMMKKIAGTFSAFFAKELGPNRVFAFDLNQVEILREDALRTADLANKQLSFKTLNEVRKDLFNLPPLEGGDEVPLIDNGNSFDTGGSSQDTNLQDDYTQDSADEYDGDEGIVITKEADSENVKLFMDKYGNWFETNQKSIETEVQKKETELLETVLNLFASMAKVSIKQLKKSFSEKSSKTKAAEGSKSKFRKNLEAEFADLEDRYVEASSGALFETVELGYNSNLDSISDQELRNQIEVLRDANEDVRKRSLRARSFDAYAEISDTSTEQVMEIVEQGLEDGKSVDAIGAEILQKFGESGARAQTIATTESLTAISIGKAAAYTNASSVIPGMLKMWVNVGDDHVRGNPSGKFAKSKADHWVLQGQLRLAKAPGGKDTTFSNGLRYPRDPKSIKREEVIRCRCDVVMIAPKDLNIS